MKKEMPRDLFREPTNDIRREDRLDRLNRSIIYLKIKPGKNSKDVINFHAKNFRGIYDAFVISSCILRLDKLKSLGGRSEEMIDHLLRYNISGLSFSRKIINFNVRAHTGEKVFFNKLYFHIISYNFA